MWGIRRGRRPADLIDHFFGLPLCRGSHASDLRGKGPPARARCRRRREGRGDYRYPKGPPCRDHLEHRRVRAPSRDIGHPRRPEASVEHPPWTRVLPSRWKRRTARADIPALDSGASTKLKVHGRVVLAPSAAASVRELAPDLKRSVREALRLIASDPYAGKRLLRELDGLWSYWARRYRVVYELAAAKRHVRVIAVGHRTTVYEDLARSTSRAKNDRRARCPRAHVSAR